MIVSPVASKAQNAVDFPPDNVPAAAPEKTEKTADECLTAPSGESPQGQRWFYRIERGTQRHCWYLRDRTEQRASQSAPALSTAAPAKSPGRIGDAAAPRAAPRPNSDARAELPAAKGRLDSETTFASKTQLLTTGDQTAGDDDVRRGQGFSRVPQPLDTFSAPPPAADSSVAEASDAVTGTNANFGMPAAPIPSASSRPDIALPKTSLQRLLIAIFGALTFAGVTASLMHRFAYLWRKRDARLRRRRMWQSAKVARNRAVPAPNAEKVAPGPDVRHDDAQGQIEEILSHIAKRASREPAAPALATSQAAAAAHGQRSSARRGARA
jgi:hypothetical protein